VPGDSVVASRLRAAGAVILGKANLAEWSNFRGANPPSGWSARGGFTRDAYRLDWDVSGSSSGSAVAAAASLCAATVGGETDGSILYPAGNNLVVGLKPTVGLISQQGIIPVARSQDTTGPMARTVTDAAILLGALQSPFGAVLGHSLPSSYTGFLVRGALNGARIGVDRRYFTAAYGAESDLTAMANMALSTMQRLGATIVDTDSGDPLAYADEERLVLLTEFKVQIASYLSGLGNTAMRTLNDLINFNKSHCSTEMRYFGQETFLQSQSTSGNLSDPQYHSARATCVQLARTQGIDGALQRNNLDAIVAPSYTFACRPAAVAGYPSISVPLGLSSAGRPAGLWMWSGFLQEPKLLGFAYDLEQQLQPRKNAPLMQGSVPPVPAQATSC
jgi:amidase